MRKGVTTAVQICSLAGSREWLNLVKGDSIKMLKDDHGFRYADSSVWKLTGCTLKSHSLGTHS